MIQIKNKWVLLTGVALFMIIACRQEEESRVEGDGVIKLQIESFGSDTRTSFDSIEGKFNWTDGDQIAIHYNTGKFYSYPVNPSDGTVVASSTATRIRDYYAVYPANIVPEDFAGEDSGGNEVALEVTLPDHYDISGDLQSDFSPVPMVALNPDGKHILDFYHLGGLVRIFCMDLPVGTKSVRVTMDKDITGTYTVANQASVSGTVPNPTISTKGTAADNVVEYTISESGLLDSEDRTVILNLPVPCGTYETVLVEVFGSPTAANPTGLLRTRGFFNKALTFDRRHGKKLHLKELVFKFHLGALSDVTINSGGGTKTVSPAFASYKDDGINQVKVPFTLEFKEEGASIWTTTPPDWLTMDPAIDPTGSFAGDPQSLGVEIAAQVNSELDPHHEELSKDFREKTDYDLSYYNVATGNTTTTRSTANTYLVQGWGTFRIPLVYGNAIKDGATNASAYTRQDHTIDDGSDFLETFVDHRGIGISQPYILRQLGDNAASHRAYDAVVLWTDSPGLVTDASCNPSYASPESGYIAFKVNRASVCEGNAVIALRRDDDGDDVPETIVWSWQIWVTDQQMSNPIAGPVSQAGVTYRFAPLNVGWCGRKTETYLERTCQVRVKQDESGYTSEATIKQEFSQVVMSGNSTYYNWGRKDPVPGSVGNADLAKPVYSPDSEQYGYQYVNKDGTYARVSVETAIQNPYIFFLITDRPHMWCDVEYRNLWNTAYDGTEAKPVTKTVYDPSPVGYKVPNPDAHTGFYFNSTTDTNFPWTEGNSTTYAGRTYAGTLFFPALAKVSCGSGNYEGSVEGIANYVTSVGDGGIRRMDFTAAYVWPGAGGYRAHGASVHPIVDE